MKYVSSFISLIGLTGILKGCLATESTADADADNMPPFITTNFFNTHIFDKAANTTIGGSAWFIKFMAPWCGHSKRLEPIWKEFYLANRFKPTVNVVRVDCTADNSKALCRTFGILGKPKGGGYPTLKFLKNSSYWTYSIQRDIKSLTSFVEGGYTEVPNGAKPIPIMLTDWEKLQEDFLGEVLVHYKGALNQVGRDFEKVGLGFVPEVARPWLIASIVLAILYATVCSCGRKSSDYAKKRLKAKKVGSPELSKQAASGKKREKLE